MKCYIISEAWICEATGKVMDDGNLFVISAALPLRRLASSEVGPYMWSVTRDMAFVIAERQALALLASYRVKLEEYEDENEMFTNDEYTSMGRELIQGQIAFYEGVVRDCRNLEHDIGVNTR